MGLIQSVIEKAGIPTVSTSVLREITEKVRPPRAVFLDCPLGYPLGAANNPALQRQVIRAALELLTREVAEPLLAEIGSDGACGPPNQVQSSVP